LDQQASAATSNVVNDILFHPGSEMIMGSLSLQPDMMDESTDLLLEEDFLKHLKEKYCSRIKVRCLQC